MRKPHKPATPQQNSTHTTQYSPSCDGALRAPFFYPASYPNLPDSSTAILLDKQPRLQYFTNCHVIAIKLS
jgi:hypothetical protein